jgi:predicted  nucleic acid-binding Zn-ribbon protein
MMATLGQRLYHLQLLDTELAEQRSRLRETEAQLGETTELREARAAQESATKELTLQRTRLKDLEFDLHGLNAKVTATANRLYGGTVTNPKELHGLQQDHEYLKRSCSKQEDDVLEAMTKLDDCEAAAAVASTRLTEVEKRWRAEQARVSKQVEQLQAKIAALAKDRAQAVAPLDASTLALYDELMKKKRGRAVAVLVGQTCGGCCVTLPSGKVQEVRRGQGLITCTNCERILVVQD